MKFKDFYNKFKTEAYDPSLEKQRNEVIEERRVSTWMIYQTIETNRKLVWATWFLAIATIILSMISLFVK